MQPSYLYEDKYMTCLKEQVAVEDKNATYYCATIKFPFDEAPYHHMAYSHTLSHIELYDFELDKRFNLIRVEYTPVDIQNMVGNYLIIDKYYKAMLSWKREDGADKFFQQAAKLAYITAHLMLVKHGNAAIIEWLFRGVAYKHGIKLGHFNYKEGISWDFKAILTPNINDYIKWFCENLFEDYALLSQSRESQKEFNF
jgi:hypothetical protein